MGNIDTQVEVGFEPLSENEMARAVDKHRDAMINHATRVYKILLEDAEDLVGEVAIKALKYRDKYNPSKGAISTFLFKVMENTFIDTTRNKTGKFHKSLLPNEAVNHEGDIYRYDISIEAEDSSQGHFISVVMSTIEQMDPKYCTLIMMRKDGLNYDEMALKTGMPLGTVKARLRKAREILFSSLVANGLVGKDFLQGKYMMDADDKSTVKQVGHYSILIAQLSKELLIS